MFCSIKHREDIINFLDETNSLHDGYIVGVQYVNDGISKTNYGHHFNTEQTKLNVKILVTSISDAIIEIEFENIAEWQIKDKQWEITDTTIMFDEHNHIVWADENCTDMNELKEGSYVIAKSMKWRII